MANGFFETIGNFGASLAKAIEQEQERRRQEERFAALQAFEFEKQSRAQAHSMKVAEFSAKLASERQAKRLELDKEIAKANRIHQGQMREIARTRLNLLRSQQSQKLEKDKRARVNEILTIQGKALRDQERELKVAVFSGAKDARARMQLAAATISQIVKDERALLEREGLLGFAERMKLISSKRDEDPVKRSLERTFGKGTEKAKEAEKILIKAKELEELGNKSDEQVIIETVTDQIPKIQRGSSIIDDAIGNPRILDDFKSIGKSVLGLKSAGFPGRTSVAPNVSDVVADEKISDRVISILRSVHGLKSAGFPRAK